MASIFSPSPTPSTSTLPLLSSNPLNLSSTMAPLRIAKLEELCAEKVAQCIHDNTYLFKSLPCLPWGVFQKVFDRVTARWTHKWNKTQVLRVLTLFCEPNLSSLILDRTIAHDYLLEAMLTKAATFPSVYSAHLLPPPSPLPASHPASISLIASSAATSIANPASSVASTPSPAPAHQEAAPAAPLGEAPHLAPPAIFPSLRTLSLCLSTQTTSRKGLVAFLMACPNLRTLRLAILDDAVLQRLFLDVDLPSLLPRLESLEVNYQGNSKTHVKRRSSQSNLFLPNSFILDLVNQPLNQLTFLSLRDRLLLTPTTIKTVTLRAPFLTHLILDNTEVTDSNLSALSRHCRHLKTLSLRECKRLSDSSFEEVGRGFLASLLHLSIAGCRKLTDTTLNYLIEGSPKLRVLDIRGCTANFVHDTSLVDLLSGLQFLEVAILSFNDSKGLDDVPPQSLQKVQVSRRFFDPATEKNVNQYYFLHNPAASSPVPHLPRPCHIIWPEAFWTRPL